MNGSLLMRSASVLASVAALAAIAAPADAKRRHCDKNYKGVCLKPNAYDYDCAGGSGDGPYYVNRAVRIVGYDHYRLDSDHDGWGCED